MNNETKANLALVQSVIEQAPFGADTSELESFLFKAVAILKFPKSPAAKRAYGKVHKMCVSISSEVNHAAPTLYQIRNACKEAIKK